MKHVQFLFILVIVTLTGCGPDIVSPYTYNTSPLYTQGSIDFYGAYYPGINSNALSLQLYTDSLHFNDNKELGGIGQYLYINDVFIPTKDSTLVSGTYQAGSQGSPMTFYALSTAANTSSYPFAYIYYYEKNSSKSVRKMINSGSFTVTKENDSYTILFDLKVNENTTLKGSYKGKIAVHKVTK